MKKNILVLVIALSTLTSSFAQEILNININKSELKWFGEYTFYFGGHDGTINFIEGHFIKTKDVISGGEFIIDMESIKNDDIKNKKGNEGLVLHLKESDFFDVENFKTARLIITSVEYHDQTSMQIYADLTIKDITHPIKFQAQVDFLKRQMTTRFKIDRRLWDINYQSKMKDSAISDAIGFEVTLSL